MRDYELGLCTHHAKHLPRLFSHLEMDLIDMRATHTYSHVLFLEFLQDCIVIVCILQHGAVTHVDCSLFHAVYNLKRGQSAAYDNRASMIISPKTVPSHKTRIVRESALATAVLVPWNNGVFVLVCSVFCAVNINAERHVTQIS